MKKLAAFLLFFIVFTDTCHAELDDPRAVKMVQEEIQAITSSYLQYLKQVLIPLMQQGAGGSAAAPVVIPPIFPEGHKVDPQKVPQMYELLEPIGKSVAYAGLLCKGIGLAKNTDMSEIYVSFPAFSRTRTQVLKKIFVGDPNNPADHLQTEISTTTVQCSELLKKICFKGSCNSGKCGNSLSLGAACVHLCMEENTLGIKKCEVDFYRGHVIPKSIAGKSNLPSVPLQGPQTINYGQQPWVGVR